MAGGSAVGIDSLNVGKKRDNFDNFIGKEEQNRINLYCGVSYC